MTGVPLIVLSAGVSEIIHASFDFLGRETGLKEKHFSTVQVISNGFYYVDGKTSSFGNLVTSTNKQETLY